MRRYRGLDSWWLDLKLGVRLLAKYPGLALVGGFGLAVAVAIAVGGFSVTYGNFLATSLPFEQGDRIISIEVWDSAANKPERRVLHEYQLWRKDLKSVLELGAFRTLTPNLIVAGAPAESVRVASITAAGFRIPRVRPLIGRYLEEEDERDNAPWVAVIGESIWRGRFGADPGILGRTLQLGTTPHTIVGVMPASFAFPVNHHFWTPLRASSTPTPPLTGPDLMVFGRLSPGATLDTAQAELATIGQHMSLASPKTHAQLRPKVLPYPYPFLGLHENSDVAGIKTMHGIVAVLLVLICLNVAILVYSRTATRQAEITVRTALGANRGRIVAQLFTEAFVLSAGAAMAGVAIAAFALRQLAAATFPIAAELPFWLSFHLSMEAVVYAALLSVLAAAIVGVVPALQATRRDAQSGLRVISAGGSGVQLGKTWTLLIVGQVAFAVALLPGAVSSAWQSMRSGMAGPGFAANEFLSAQLGMDAVPAGATVGGTVEFTSRYAARQAELIRRLSANSRVSNLTFALAIPGDEPGALIEPQGGAAETVAQEVRFNCIDPSFFRVFEVPILAGRGFQSADLIPAGADTGLAPPGETVIVNRSFAQRIFGGNALGRRVRYVARNPDTPGQTTAKSTWYEIVGIVSDFPTGVTPGMDDSELKLYHAAAVGQLQPVSLAVRLRDANPLTFSVPLRDITAAVDPDLHLRNILTLDEALRREQWIRRLEATVLGAVTLSVLLLSAAGIYALMSITVAQRRKEIGIRAALGADPKRIVAGIFSKALLQLAVGAALGVAVASGLESTWKGMRGNAVVVVPLVALLMTAVGLLAAIGPARRSLRIQPTDALREQ